MVSICDDEGDTASNVPAHEQDGGKRLALPHFLQIARDKLAVSGQDRQSACPQDIPRLAPDERCATQAGGKRGDTFGVEEKRQVIARGALIMGLRLVHPEFGSCLHAPLRAADQHARKPRAQSGEV